jgi:formamidopyrimidine-DNA glycosylase
LSRIEAIGKNLFYFWGKKDEAFKRSSTVVHIHFGMSGQFKTAGVQALEAGPNTRLELINEEDDLCAHLSAMTCKHGDFDFYEAKKKALGQDPLREDADKELVWEAFKKSRKSVGMLLMDQSVIAGLGNIYRAEVLFKAGVHPEQPGNTIDYESFNNIWDIQRTCCIEGSKRGAFLLWTRKRTCLPLGPEDTSTTTRHAVAADPMSGPGTWVAARAMRAQPASSSGGEPVSPRRQHPN